MLEDTTSAHQIKPSGLIAIKKLKDVLATAKPAPKVRKAKRLPKAEPNQLAPSLMSTCRNMAGGDLAAGVLLYRIVGLWRFRKTKLTRFNMEWIAYSREEWARSAGLSMSELKDRALPRLKKSVPFLTFRTMRLNRESVNLLWVSVDMTAWDEAGTPWDMYEPMLNGQAIGGETKAYPYKAE